MRDEHYKYQAILMLAPQVNSSVVDLFDHGHLLEKLPHTLFPLLACFGFHGAAVAFVLQPDMSNSAGRRASENDAGRPSGAEDGRIHSSALLP